VGVGWGGGAGLCCDCAVAWVLPPLHRTHTVVHTRTWAESACVVGNDRLSDVGVLSELLAEGEEGGDAAEEPTSGGGFVPLRARVAETFGAAESVGELRERLREAAADAHLPSRWAQACLASLDAYPEWQSALTYGCVAAACAVCPCRCLCLLGWLLPSQHLTRSPASSELRCVRVATAIPRWGCRACVIRLIHAAADGTRCPDLPSCLALEANVAARMEALRRSRGGERGLEQLEVAAALELLEEAAAATGRGDGAEDDGCPAASALLAAARQPALPLFHHRPEAVAAAQEHREETAEDGGEEAPPPPSNAAVALRRGLRGQGRMNVRSQLLSHLEELLVAADAGVRCCVAVWCCWRAPSCRGGEEEGKGGEQEGKGGWGGQLPTLRTVKRATTAW
jgi:hypothetical protein